MLGAENKCHAYKQNHIEYSPEVNIWLTRRWTLGSVKKYLEGRVPDPRNLYKRCDRQDIPDPRGMKLDDVEIEIFICGQKIDDLRAHAPKMRIEHLRLCLAKAKEEQREDKAASIVRILRKEANKKRWRRVNRSTRKPQGGAVVAVKVPTAEGHVEVTSEDDIFTNKKASGVLTKDYNLTGFRVRSHICDHLNYWLRCRPTISRDIAIQIE